MHIGQKILPYIAYRARKIILYKGYRRFCVLYRSYRKYRSSSRTESAYWELIVGLSLVETVRGWSWSWYLSTFLDLNKYFFYHGQHIGAACWFVMSWILDSLSFYLQMTVELGQSGCIFSSKVLVELSLCQINQTVI